MQFERLVKQAGLEAWPRLFHAMRASRETELARDYLLHVVTSWLGNTPRIAMKHYLQVTDDDFSERAKAARWRRNPAQKAAHRRRMIGRSNQQQSLAGRRTQPA